MDKLTAARDRVARARSRVERMRADASAAATLRAEIAELRQDFRAMASRPTNFTLGIDAATFKMPEYPAPPAPITNVAAPDFGPLEKAMSKLADAIKGKETKVVVNVPKPDPIKVDVKVEKPDAPPPAEIEVPPPDMRPVADALSELVDAIKEKDCKVEIMAPPRAVSRDAEVEFDRDSKKATIRFKS